MSNVEWDSKLVIGNKAQARRPVAIASTSNSALNAVRLSESQIPLSVDRRTAGGSNKAHQGPDHQRIAKLDRDNEVAPPPKINPAVGKAMQTARLAMQLSQKDLAAKINEKQSVLADIETGKATANPQILGKIERQLGVKLRGNEIGKKLEGPRRAAASTSTS
ncbi:probable MBF1-multiprotein bridging factor mediates GCN4-dependent transcriptional activation [Serendipita indica DSM 11827]|uniref:Probable MBF1-multiprotein bridging factor mediates GCN4-dependent transcriptional activation n=1 Tax=Serendipita indica (strain DSM 11827) TaxID=1109443 RepID=G4TUM6_SERID|nr:probable MBF1-multiprotein bridging factor mediates GCN4-dependent transcriptional activation [Serendipita indica DSM 11827]